MVISVHDVHEAAKRIAPYVKQTPVMTSEKFNQFVGADVFFKCENFQHVGAFKARGAMNAVFALSDEDASYGVVAHSSGNHAAALCLAARNRGISARIVMPENSNKVKIAQVRELGGQIEFCIPTAQAREQAAAAIVEETGARLIHPFNDAHVIAGQGSVALELLSEVSGLDAILAPVGGGGLMSGCALTAKAIKPDIFTCGAEPKEVNDAARSLRSGQLQGNVTTNSIADGLRGDLGQMAFDILKKHLDELVEVSEANIVAAMRFIWSDLKIIIEPSSAVAIAALMAERSRIKGDRIGVVITGGNVDLDELPW
ncbi:pyridoxal-phosphate dependent enzyme [Hirschia baltica]|nr:pyridoxal-phosphate dependent enzyme [Hirschia baltica]